jgi:hypothetical protein
MSMNWAMVLAHLASKGNSVSRKMDTQRKRYYGITGEQYRNLLLKQEGRCAGCGKGETSLNRNGEVRSLAVDHCHTTGAVRGLLCDGCNNAISRANDSPSILRRLAAYLEVADTGLGTRFINVDAALAELSIKEN